MDERLRPKSNSKAGTERRRAHPGDAGLAIPRHAACERPTLLTSKTDERDNARPSASGAIHDQDYL
jgi:hypothetical protein